jgi:hypothetical protein
MLLNEAKEMCGSLMSLYRSKIDEQLPEGSAEEFEDLTVALSWDGEDWCVTVSPYDGKGQKIENMRYVRANNLLIKIIRLTRNERV